VVDDDDEAEGLDVTKPVKTESVLGSASKEDTVRFTQKEPEHEG
jgi:hypothetical protein